jgi:hypothetical protein
VEMAFAWWLRSPEANGCVWGDGAWTGLNGSWFGEWSGDVTVGDPLRLGITYRPLRPDQPTVLLRCRDVAWRIDHNGGHRVDGRVEYQSHVQLEGSDLYEPVDPHTVGSPQRGQVVDLPSMERTLRRSAQFFNVTTRGLVWTAPEGGAR